MAFGRGTRRELPRRAPRRITPTGGFAPLARARRGSPLVAPLNPHHVVPAVELEPQPPERLVADELLGGAQEQRDVAGLRPEARFHPAGVLVGAEGRRPARREALYEAHPGRAVANVEPYGVGHDSRVP